MLIKIKLLVFCLLLVLSMFAFQASNIVKGEQTYLKVVNSLTGDEWFNFTIIEKNWGDTFVINITVVDITDLQNWQIKLTWDPSLLTYVGISRPADHVFSGAGHYVGPDWVPYGMIPPPVDTGPGYVVWGCTYENGERGTPDYWTFNGTGRLCQVTLKIVHVVSPGNPEVSCDLALVDKGVNTFLLNGDVPAHDIEFDIVNGSYFYRWVTPPYPTLYIKPATCEPVKKDEVFGLEVWVTDVYAARGIFCFQFSLMWNTTFVTPAWPYCTEGTFLEAFQYYPDGVGYFADINTHRRPYPMTPVPDDYNYSTFGIMIFPEATVWHPPFPQTPPDGLLMTVYFRAVSQTIYPAEDWTWIEFIEWVFPGNDPQDTFALTVVSHVIPVNTVPCHYRAPQIFNHDVAITNITPSQTVIGQGGNIDINTTAENQGLFDETFNITAYANTTIIAKFENVTLTSGNSTTLSFTWNTTDAAFGNHTLWAEATVVPEEIDTVDNTFVDDTIRIEPTVHDVAITDVQIAPNFVYVGENVTIQVDAWNLGNMPETFNVTTYADKNPDIIGDEITIETQSLFLESKSFSTLTFTWNTTDLSSDNYTISAAASNIPQEADPTNNLYVNGKVGIFVSIPCYDINIICPIYIKLNPSIFQFDWNLKALKVSLGDMTIDSVGYEGLLRVLGSTNDTLHLRVHQPDLEFADYYLPQSGSVKVPLWLVFDPGTYSGTYELQLTVCGTHRIKITINIVSISVCGNGVYDVAGGTVTFSYTLEGGSWVYLEAEPNLPPGWSYTVDPPTKTLFETPHEITVNITAAADAQEGDIGSVTLRAYKNETNILIWQYTYFASIDNNPPVIETMQPPILTSARELLFNTTVRDTSGIESVQLYYSVNYGEWNQETMRWNSGDTFSSTSYILTISQVPDNSIIEYYIVATDWLKNQTTSDIQTITIKYDLAIAEVETNKTFVGQEYATQINVSIVNEGTISIASLKISVYANTTLIYIQTVPFLGNGTAANLTFYWDTTGFAKGEYTISAYAWPLPLETDTTDNLLIGSVVSVGVPCDVIGPENPPESGEYPPDGICNMRDIGYFCANFMTDYANCDVTGPTPYMPDGIVNMRDIGEACNNFMKKDP